jgi:hypothetical protein
MATSKVHHRIQYNDQEPVHEVFVSLRVRSAEQTPCFKHTVRRLWNGTFSRERDRDSDKRVAYLYPVEDPSTKYAPWYNRLCCAQDIHFPSPMIIESLKPLGIFNTRVKQVPQISFTIDCKRGFISTQNFLKEIIINLQLMIAKSQNSMRALK